MLTILCCRSAHQIKSSPNLAFVRTSSSKDNVREIKPVSSHTLQNSPSELNSTESEVGEAKFPEEPTTCCMSGCANCVWLDYAEKVSAYYKDGGQKALNDINEKVSDPNIRAFLLQEIKSTMK